MQPWVYQVWFKGQQLSLRFGAVCCRFGPDGRIDIEIQNFKYYHEEGGNPVDLTKIGFFIALTDSEDDLDNDISEVCGILVHRRLCTLFRSCIFQGYGGLCTVSSCLRPS